MGQREQKGWGEEVGGGCAGRGEGGGGEEAGREEVRRWEEEGGEEEHDETCNELGDGFPTSMSTDTRFNTGIAFPQY